MNTQTGAATEPRDTPKLGRRIEPLIPGSEPWLRNMSASKVPAVLGLSRWDSPFSLWHRMAGTYQPKEQTAAQSRGHYLEPAIAAWWADQWPTAVLTPGACWQHSELDWYTASPDRLIYHDDGAEHPMGILEVKSAADADEWGKPGTDEIPVGYRAQVVAQMDIVGVDIARVAVLLPFLEFREYVVDYNPAEANYIRSRCELFMRSIREGKPPALDAHGETYKTVRALQPDVDGSDIDVPADLAHAFTDSYGDLTAATEAHQAAKSLLLDHMGSAKRALWNGQPIAERRTRGDGLPYIQAHRSLRSLA